MRFEIRFLQFKKNWIIFKYKEALISVGCLHINDEKPSKIEETDFGGFIYYSASSLFLWKSFIISITSMAIFIANETIS